MSPAVISRGLHQLGCALWGMSTPTCQLFGLQLFVCSETKYGDDYGLKFGMNTHTEYNKAECINSDLAFHIISTYFHL